MTVDETKTKIDTESDFIALKRFEYSLEKLMERYPEGAPMKVIAQALVMTEDEVNDLYEKIIIKLRQSMNVEVE